MSSPFLVVAKTYFVLDTERMDQAQGHAAAIQFLGGPSSVARLRGRTPWAISKWMRDGIPPHEVLWLSEATGWKFSPHQLSPRLYPHPDDGLPQEHRSREAA